MKPSYLVKLSFFLKEQLKKMHVTLMKLGMDVCLDHQGQVFSEANLGAYFLLKKMSIPPTLV